MVVPIPETWNEHRYFDATVGAVTSNFLFKAFHYRVDQATAGKPHDGLLSAELLAELEEIKLNERTSGAQSVSES